MSVQLPTCDADARYVTEFVRRWFSDAPAGELPATLTALVHHELSRTEELTMPLRDQWGNWEWPFGRSAREGTLYRPFVDERLLAWRDAHAPALRRTPWPDERPFALCLTHDVDFVSRRASTLGVVAERARRLARVSSGERGLAARLLARELARLALAPLLRALGTDEYHNFDAWMALEAEHGFTSTFFFFAEHLAAVHAEDACYGYAQSIRFEGEAITVAELMRRMRARGWEIGLHASIAAATDADALIAERAQLERAVGAEVTAVRHHYLAYDAAVTPSVHDRARMRADSTMGYNRNVGFRAGTSFPFRCWDHHAGRAARVVEVPLLLHDVALFAVHGLECDETLGRAYIVTVMDAVERVGGCLTVNWHPSWWPDERFAGSYRFLLEEARRRGAWGGSMDALARHVGDER